MDVPLLRTLTWKSTLGFGKYKELRIQEIFDLRHTAYLRYIYYNISGINFIEDILIEIGVITTYGDDRIEKPGIDPEKGKWLDGLNFNNLVKLLDNAGHAKYKIKGIKLHHLKTIMRKEKITYSKGNLQRINHGHKYKH